jgi:hypothetical protein
MRMVYFLLVFFIFLSCEKDEDETNYPEFRGNHIYSSEVSKDIGTIHWISDDEIVVLEYEGEPGYSYHNINTLKIIDIQYNSNMNIDLIDGQIKHSVISDNKKFLYYSVASLFSDTIQRSFIRLDLATGEKWLIVDNMRRVQFNIISSGSRLFCVSSDDSKIAYYKFSSDSVCIYDITDNKEVSIMSGFPILFTHDNTELLISGTTSYPDFSLPLFSYNLESGQSKMVLLGEIINYLNSDFKPDYLINAINDNNNILLILCELIPESNNNFLIYNLTETNPIFGGAMDDVSLYLLNWYSHYGSSFAIDTKRMKMFSWTYECLEYRWDLWGGSCLQSRSNLYCIDMISRNKTRIGNILSARSGTTIISPDGTKVAYVLRIYINGYWRNNAVYVYDIYD